MEKTKISKIPVIYILSTGRSGSTLLDLLLGLHPQIWTLGEAQILPLEVRDNQRPCGCGSFISECDFWKPILPQIPLDVGRYPIDYFRAKWEGKALRYSYLPQILRRKINPNTMQAVEEYGRLNEQYFRIVWEATQSRKTAPVAWLVDASKDIYRLFLLMHSQYFDFRVIHLMKDPRAFVYSMTKDKPELSSRSIRFAGRWIVQNMQFAHFCADNNLTNKVMKIRYEELAKHPEKSLARIGTWLNLDFSNVSYTDFRQQENHAVSGNPMRWRNTGISLDEKWRRALPLNSSNVIWAMTGVLARHWGYSF